MPNMKVENKLVDISLRSALEKQGYKLTPERQHGETGVDILATKNSEQIHIEVIGYKLKGETRSKDFFEVFFRAVSRLNDGAKKCVIALPCQWKKGFSRRVANYKIAWERIGKAFPEVEIWFVDVDMQSYEIMKWCDCLKQFP